MTIKRLDHNTYELVGVRFDYHIRKEGRTWYIDSFFSGEKDANKAYVATETAGSLDGALETCFDIDKEKPE